ncbi:MAG: penicillin-binding protein activator LpoB [Candidatus Fermentibacterota bacterium]
MSRLLAAFAVAALAVLAACGGRTVTRTDTDTTTDLSGRWNDTDARMVADSMVDQALNGDWLVEHGRGRESYEKPVVVVGSVINRSSEHIGTDVFMNEIQRALLESGLVRLSAGRGEDPEVRAERYDQQRFASPETAAEFGQEVGADYVMMGSVDSITDEEGDTRAVYYQVSLELIDVETALKVWMGSLEIKKIIEW